MGTEGPYPLSDLTMSSRLPSPALLASTVCIYIHASVRIYETKLFDAINAVINDLSADVSDNLLAGKVQINEGKNIIPAKVTVLPGADFGISETLTDSASKAFEKNGVLPTASPLYSTKIV